MVINRKQYVADALLIEAILSAIHCSFCDAGVQVGSALHDFTRTRIADTDASWSSEMSSQQRFLAGSLFHDAVGYRVSTFVLK